VTSLRAHAARAGAAAALALGPGAFLSPVAAEQAPAAPVERSATPTVGVTSLAPPVNAAPVAGDDAAATRQGLQVVVDLLANDTDPDGDPLMLVGGTSAGHGSVSFDGGSATYTADAAFTGVDTFTYLVGDDHGGTDSAVVSISVGARPAAAPPAVPPTTTPPRPVAPRPAVAPVAVRTAPRPVAAVPDTFAVPAAAPRQPATLPFSGAAVDSMLPLGAALVLAGASLARAGRRRGAAA
jgi:hypothetical protein